MAKQQKQETTMDDNFRQNMVKARACVSAELAKHGIAVDVRLLTTISVMTSVALKFFKEEINSREARTDFDKAIDMYQNSNTPF